MSFNIQISASSKFIKGIVSLFLLIIVLIKELNLEIAKLILIILRYTM